MDDETVTVTEEWLREHATGKAGWTYQQLRALGVSTPPRRGWLRAILGTEVSVEQARAFERGREGAKRKSELERLRAVADAARVVLAHEGPDGLGCSCFAQLQDAMAELDQ